MRRTIDTRRPAWPPRPPGHPVAIRILRVLDGRTTTTNDQTDERSR